MCSVELIEAIKSTFTPIPELLEFTEMFDVKSWMKEIIPPIHDHLKAHQFKFISTKDGIHMFYKQWSTDDMWLPSQGIGILDEAYQSNAIPIPGIPTLVKPKVDKDDLQKLQTMVMKVQGYLDKSGAKIWWDKWLSKAKDISLNLELPTQGSLCGLNKLCT